MPPADSLPHSRSNASRPPAAPIAAGLALCGAVALAVGVWALGTPTAFAAFIRLAVDQPVPRLGLSFGLGIAFLITAVYLTRNGPALRKPEVVAAWLLVGWLWLGGMLLVYAPQEHVRSWLIPLLADPLALWLAGLSSMVAGAVLLGLASALWPPPRPRRRSTHGQPLQRPAGLRGT